MPIIVLMQRQGLGPYFTTRQATRAGASAAQLRSSDWDAPFSGVRADPDAIHDLSGWGEREREHLHRAKALASRQDADAFNTHVTAAVVWQIPLPPWTLDDAKIDLGTFAPARSPRIAGVNGHEVRRRLATAATEPTTGLRVTTPASTWAMLGSVLRHPYDVVAAGDAVVRTWRVGSPLATISQLDAAVRAGRRVGIARLREALPRIRTGSASRPETWMRLTIADAGLPEPELNHDIVAAGVKIACVDGAYPALRIALEYEGEHHLKDPGQWAYDIRRYEALEAAGWIVIRITKTELFGAPGEFIVRVRRAIARRT